MEKLYVVTMYRYNNRELHSYPIGVFSTEQDAISAGKLEQSWIGGKYEPEIAEVDLDCRYYGPTDHKEVSPRFVRNVD